MRAVWAERGRREELARGKREKAIAISARVHELRSPLAFPNTVRPIFLERLLESQAKSTQMFIVKVICFASAYWQDWSVNKIYRESVNNLSETSHFQCQVKRFLVRRVYLCL